MDELMPLPIGRRVAAFRKLRGLTQAGLAARLHRSESWVRKIERGERRTDSLAVLDELSRALAVPVYQLTGQFEVPLGEGGQHGAEGVADLRSVLDRPVGVGLHEGGPCDVARLERDAAALRRLYDTSTHHLSTVLPRLAEPIIRVQAGVRAALVAERPRVHGLLAGLYQIAAAGLRNLGDMPRARVAIDRAFSAADQSGDPLRLGAVAGYMALQLMSEGDGSDGSAIAIEIADLVARAPQAATDAGAVVFGGAYGFAAVAAAKVRDESEARRLLKAASGVAETLGRDREAYGISFGPMNLAVQEMAVLVDLDQPQEAVRRGEQIRPDQLGKTCRVGQHHAWFATAQARCGDDDGALATLAAGIRAAPEVLRRHSLVREIVRDLLHRRRRADERLRRVARVINVSG